MSMTISDYVSSLNARKNLSKSQKASQATMEKLSSGNAINKASDNPAGLLISEMLRSQLSGYQRALSNTQESNNMMSIAEGGLSSVNSMLDKMKGLAIHAMNSGVTTNGQVTADQMQMNSALSSINRVVSTTNYGSTNLLDGSRDFSFGTADSAGIIDASGSSISSVAGSIPNNVSVSYDGHASSQAEKAYVEADFGGAELGTAQEFTVTGNDGGHTFSFAAGTSVADMAEQINSLSDSTGVNAYAIRDQGTGATALRLVSGEYGSEAMVQVDQTTGDGFAAAGGSVRDTGQDVTIGVGGERVTGRGLEVDYTAGGVKGHLSMNAGDPGSAGVAQTGYDQDTLTDADARQGAAVTNIRGGMQLQLGEGSGSQNRETVSLGNYGGGSLGSIEVDGERYSLNDLYGGGRASLQNNPELALKIIDQAISDVSSGRANIGAYQANTLDANAESLMTAFENTTRTESAIRDADMAKLISDFSTSQLQQEAGLRVMQMQMQRMNPANVLQLLGGF